MEKIIFIDTGNPLKIKFVVKNGVLAVAYTINLYHEKSNTPIATYKGDNKDPNDDTFLLPVPTDENGKLVIELIADFRGVDLALSKQFNMGFEVYQGNILLKCIYKEGSLKAEDQSITLYAQLLMSQLLKQFA